MLLSTRSITCQYGEKVLLDDISLNIENNDKIGLIGVNGSGKSTLLSILAKQKEPEKGVVEYIGKTKISYLSQTPKFNEEKTINELLNEELTLDVALHEAKANLTKLEIFDFDKKICNLSGGTKRKIALGLALSKPCDLLILDEPTNHLDCDIIEWLEKKLIKYTKAILLVTHDRYFLERVVNKIIELEHGKIYEYNANYSTYLELKQERMASIEAKERKVSAFLRKEYEWIKRGPQARATKDKKRIENYEKLANEKKIVDKKIELESSYTRLGNKTIEFVNVSKAYEKNIFSDVSFILPKDARIGIIGKNGAGKSTLMDLLSGETLPTTGEVIFGQTIKIGYFKQENTLLDESVRAIDYINDIATIIKTKKGTISSTQMLENFLFDPYTYISKLSGGEKRRLLLLGVLMHAPNVLLFDEPTNDLDITTLNILEDYLSEFEGIVIIASHDRFLLDKIVDTIFVLEDNSFSKYNGNYSTYINEIKPNKKVEKNDKINITNNKQVKKESNKLSFKEKKEFETIEQEIDFLEKQMKTIDEEINKYYADYQKCKELMDRKKELSTLYEYKMERWEYLSNKES